MHYVRRPEREQFRDELENHIENLKVLISHTAAQSRDHNDLRTTGAHLFAALKTLDRHGSTEIEAARETDDSSAECARLITATLVAAGAMQEAMACVDLLSLRVDVVPSWSDFRELSDRLARADAAFRMVAAHTIKARVLAQLPGDAGYLYHLRGRLRIPGKTTTHSDAWRPPVPIDDDQCGAGAEEHRWMRVLISVFALLPKRPWSDSFNSRQLSSLDSNSLMPSSLLPLESRSITVMICRVSCLNGRSLVSLSCRRNCSSAACFLHPR